MSTHSDSELLTQALCLTPPEGEVNGPDWPARIRHLMKLAPLSYSLVIMIKDRIYGVRDPYGNRPLCLGKIVPVSHTHATPDHHVIGSGNIEHFLFFFSSIISCWPIKTYLKLNFLFNISLIEF